MSLSEGSRGTENGSTGVSDSDEAVAGSEGTVGEVLGALPGFKGANGGRAGTAGVSAGKPPLASLPPELVGGDIEYGSQLACSVGRGFTCDPNGGLVGAVMGGTAAGSSSVGFAASGAGDAPPNGSGNSRGSCHPRSDSADDFSVGDPVWEAVSDVDSATSSLLSDVKQPVNKTTAPSSMA
jgi:hypothetical protein